ncbi:MAG: hypothetical protein LC804_04065 [Acidobacteria bacterium]|nr:hypothetical protein [Acidobacteriota bacterium]MCA1583588.1 hypothetical protein [Acidobacteriota bacterium]
MIDRPLFSFLRDVVRYPVRLAQFEANPEEEVTRAGLTEEERAAVISRDSRRLLRLMHASGLSVGESSFEGPPRPPRSRPKPGKPGKPAKPGKPGRPGPKKPSKPARKKN